MDNNLKKNKNIYYNNYIRINIIIIYYIIYI